MGAELFEGYNEFLKKHFGRSASKESFKDFVKYCQKGVEREGVTPILNPINLYAFGMGLTSDQALELAFRKE